MQEPDEPTEWTETERQMFVQAVLQHNRNWDVIAQQIGTKSLYQVMRYAREIQDQLMENPYSHPKLFKILKRRVRWDRASHEEFVQIIKEYGHRWQKEGCLQHSNKTKEQFRVHFQAYYLRALKDPTIPNAELFKEYYYSQKFVYNERRKHKEELLKNEKSEIKSEVKGEGRCEQASKSDSAIKARDFEFEANRQTD